MGLQLQVKGPLSRAEQILRKWSRRQEKGQKLCAHDEKPRLGAQHHSFLRRDRVPILHLLLRALRCPSWSR